MCGILMIELKDVGFKIQRMIVEGSLISEWYCTMYSYRESHQQAVVSCAWQSTRGGCSVDNGTMEPTVCDFLYQRNKKNTERTIFTLTGLCCK